MDDDALQRRLRDAGLGEAALQSLQQLVRPALALRTDGAARPDSSGSRLGGVPLLPDDVTWPAWGDRPLTFICLLDLAELAHVADIAPLPSTGRLAFFYEPTQQAWGFDPGDRGAARIVHMPASQPVSPREFPTDLEVHERFAPVALRPEPLASWPDPGSEAVAQALSGRDRDLYWDVVAESEYDPSSSHQLLGWPQPVQGPMELECQLASNGINVGGPKGYRSRQARKLAAGASDWRLLLQIDTDTEAGFMWGDAGMLYVWIRDQDLQAGRFEATWTILQCH